MNLNNPFPKETRLLFLYVYSCFKCNRSDQGLELHHITGRDSSSAFNACPLCKVCHEKIGHSQEEERDLFLYTKVFLRTESYEADENDAIFLASHPHLK